MNIHSNILKSNLALVGILSVFAASCAVSNEAPSASKIFQTARCLGCHGDADSPAPPGGVQGVKSSTNAAVGAHRSHLNDGKLRKAIDCTECHRVPHSWRDAGHVDTGLPAEIVFGALAKANGSQPSWNHDSMTCSSVYCHGETVSGGLHKDPVWTKVDGTQKTCKSCHGYPPDAPHLSKKNCNVCHPDTVASDGSIIVTGDKHINGKLDVAAVLSCNACHGSETSFAPPVDLSDHTATTEIGVGAHQSHMKDGTIRQAIACSECHQVPQSYGDSGHADSLMPAELTFGSLAKAEGSDPSWDRSTKTCSNTYCHGEKVGGGAKKDPVWTEVDGTQKNCSSCHGYPPPAPHIKNTSCSLCHPDTVTSDGSIIIAKQKHINGDVDLAPGGLSCISCHGSENSIAPPIDLSGNSETTEIGVGAHQSHLNDGTLRDAIECSECHQVPQSIDDEGHADSDTPAELTFGALAKAEGSDPSWDRSTKTCSNTYCHGEKVGGGAKKDPVWTKVDGTQKTCSSCHGFPPPAPHVAKTNCSMCHPETVANDGNIITANKKHINGSVDLAPGGLSCNSCHGSNDSIAPPVDLSGNSATTEIGVGAHQSHLNDGTIRKAIECSECHTVPQSIDDSGHADSDLPAELNFGSLAKNENSTPAWNRGEKTCSNTYCHGATLIAGGKNRSPIWTKVDGSQKTCDSCHGYPPAAPHSTSQKCDFCHNLDQHVDGLVEFAMAPNKFIITGPAQAQERVCVKYQLISTDLRWNSQPTVRDMNVKFLIYQATNPEVFYLDSTCQTQVSSVKVLAGTSALDIYFKAPSATKMKIRAATTSWTWREKYIEINVVPPGRRP